MSDDLKRRDPMVAKRAFDAIAAAQKVTTLDELNRILGVSFGQLGFDHFVGVATRDGPSGREVDVRFGATHAGWEKHYQSHDYAKHDAVLHEMLLTGEPLFWSDVGKRKPVPPKGKLILDEAREFGLANGFVTPSLHLDGSISTVLLVGRHIDDQDTDVRAAAHILSIYYSSIGRRIHLGSIHGAAMPILSQRQLECLKWVRQGKSSNDIGDILGLSAHTVNEYIAGACSRLGVRTRTQAVAEAALHGILDL